ncbi:MAG: membrane-bound lytic murein transglycosylase MltF [Gammaproteobacteria bacterium]|nr:membrane-bound lytic murein transglycosylase MltF [Gammaproteobacteria bacterium]
MKALLALVATLLLATCSQPPPLLDQILASGELRVVTRNSPDAYYLGSHGPEGPAYELASRFAENLGVALRLYTVRTREAAINEVSVGRAHLAAAGTSTGIELPDSTHFGPGYQLVREHLVYRRRGSRPPSIRDAAQGQIEVVAGSAHQRTLEELRLQYPDLVWIERADSDTEEILNDVSRGTVQYTLASSTEFALNRAVHPDLAIALDLSPQRAISWVVSTSGHDMSLLARVNAFFVLSRADGLITALLDRYYGNRDSFDYLLSRNFMEHLQTRLPQYLLWFKEAALKYGLDWRLLAAMGYQESKWDSSAVSFTGARGLMQLTEDTAAMMRYGDRSDPRASIFGGAKYLARMLDTVPQRIPEPDRTWIAVAAYNVGFGHVEDARILAQQQGRNPDRWDEIREVLPLLSQERWYANTKRGYARGWEPVRYVDNVQAYLNILEVAGTGSARALPEATPRPGAAGRAHKKTPERNGKR